MNVGHCLIVDSRGVGNLVHCHMINTSYNKMAASSTGPPNAPPPPPPPPPLIDNNSSVSNGLSLTQTLSEENSAASMSPGDGTKPWQRAWSVDEMRKGAKTWSLASDAGMLLYLQEFSQNMISQTHKMEQKVDGLVHETKGISAKVQNTFNDFLMLSNTQFIENRVYDEEETKDEEVKNDEMNGQEKEKTREELESEVIPKINQAILSGLSVLENAFVTVEILPEQMSDEEDEGNLPENFRPEPILELTDVYAHRKLPCFIGTQAFQQDDLVGLAESSSEDEEASDNEASVKSDDKKSSDDEDSSESEEETVGSSSSSEDSSTATESEQSKDSEESDEEEEVVQKKERKKEKVQDASDDDLFAAGGVGKSQSKASDESSEEESEDEQPTQKLGGPLDFSAELAAKIGAKIPKPQQSDEDEDNDDMGEQDWEESGRHDSMQDKEDLFSASVDTTSSVRSKESKKKGKSKHKKPRSGSHTSHDSGAVVGVVPSSAANDNDLEKSGKDHGDDQDDLFTSSIDTTVSTVSKSGKHKHKHKNKKNARSDSQLSNASSKAESVHKHKKEDNLFGASPEDDLFDDGLSDPFGKKGGMFSGGSGLFDDVNEDQEETHSVKSDDVDKSPAQSTKDYDESGSHEAIVKQKPRTSSSGKKLPAGAVAIFGDQGPFGHMPVHAGEHIDKSHHTPEKKQEKAAGGLFSDDGDDMFTSSQSSSVAANKPVPTKAPKTIDLFGDDNDDEDDEDDSLFGAKPVTKEEPKSQPPKKKLPAGAVSIFGASPPPLFTSPTANDKPVTPTTSSSDVKRAPAADGSGLFDEDDQISSRAVLPTAVPKVPTKPKRKSNQISLFDDDDQEDEEDGDGLFASIVPSKGISINKSSKPEQPKEEKTVGSKLPPKKSTISLFDDDDEGDEQDDIFSSKPTTALPKTNEKAGGKKPPSKQAMPTGGLFGTEEDDLFAETKQEAEPVPLSKEPIKDKQSDKARDKGKKQISATLVSDDDDLFDVAPLKEPPLDPLMSKKPTKDKPKANDKPSEKQSSAILVSDEDDLFAEPRSKQPSVDPLANKEDSTVDKSVKQREPVDVENKEHDLFTESIEKPPADPLLVDSAAVSKTASKEDINEPTKDLFDDDENDVVDGGGIIPPKTTKKLPGAVSLFGGLDIFAGQKPGKIKRKPQADDLFGDDEDDLFSVASPPKPVPVVAPRSKPRPKKEPVEVPKTTTSASQHKMPVQPVLPVSSANENSNVGKLQKTLAFNPAAMLPGAVRPPKKQDDASEATFDKPPSVKILDSSAKDRVRVRGKRRPPTRQARKTAADESISDSSLFGSDISKNAASDEGLSETDGKPKTQLFSDSDDLFSSNSYQAPEKSDLIKTDTSKSQTKVTKSDPLLDSFESTSTANSSLFLEDSIDGIKPKSEHVKPEPGKLKEQEDTIPDIFRQEPTSKSLNDSLFDKSNGKTSDAKSISQTLLDDDEEDEDDLFKTDHRPLFSPPPLDFDSEASASGDFMKPKTSNNELFSKDTASDKDIFATLPKTSHIDNKQDDKKDKENEQKNEDSTEPKEKTQESKPSTVDDIFGDTGSIFDDVPKKPKEKKKKKPTATKEGSIFDDTKGATGDQDGPGVKTTKKAKGKKKGEKKGKSKISIFDDDSPNIFDDPLNATSK